MEKYEFCYNTPIGKIVICDNGIEITELYMTKHFESEYLEETSLIKETYLQLTQYFNGNRKVFDIPVHIPEIGFQTKVWNALLDIPYGTTCSYGEIAKTIKNPKSARAVGNACNKNKLLILIPCHRVIGANKKLVGYAAGISVKEFLLNLEKY